jgi:hypothetical protein
MPTMEKSARKAGDRRVPLATFDHALVPAFIVFLICFSGTACSCFTKNGSSG